MDDNLLRLLGTVGMNGLLWGFKKVAPKVPAAIVPLINVGLTTGIALYAPWLLTMSDALVISGGSTMVHSTIKNFARGDKLGQDSVPIPLDTKPSEVKVVPRAGPGENLMPPKED